MLKRSTDRKVANGIRMSKPRDTTKTGKPVAIMANAFGLVAGASCPGATSACDSVCYASKNEVFHPSVGVVVSDNFEQLRDANIDEMIHLLGTMIRGFDAECDEKGLEKLFRVHWDGDFFNLTYVVAWQRVMKANPQIRFWAYTRSVFAVPLLLKVENLALYFSTDSQNKAIAEILNRTTGVKLAYLADTFDDGKRDMQALGLKATRCPENNGALPLADANGSACVQCGLCIDGRANVLFSVTKK
jgi:hypothetical protein